MYPATGYNLLFTFTDLPQSLAAPGFNSGGGTETFNKVQAPYLQRPDRSYLVFYEGEQEPEPSYQPNSLLYVTDTSAFGNEGIGPVPTYFIWQPFTYDLYAYCIIGLIEGQEDDEFPTAYASFEDDFSDTYLATCGKGQEVGQKIYRREGICKWVSRDIDGVVNGYLYYRSGATEQEAKTFGTGRILWALSGVGFRSPNTGPYDSPAGKYGDNEECEVVAVE